MSSLFFLIGLPRSGKSTTSQDWLHFQCDIRQGQLRTKRFHYKELFENPRIVVNADQIRLAIYDKRFWVKGEDLVHATKNLIARLYLQMGYDVLVDGTHTTGRSIKELLRLDIDADYYMVDTPQEECEARALACGHDDLVSKGIIRNMNRHLLVWKHDPAAYINTLREQVKNER